MSALVRIIRENLRPTPDRLGGTLRITVSALLVAVVMLAFRMPFLYIGPYLVFILSQRDMFLTRAAAALGLVVALVSTLAIYFVAWLAWDTGWLRVGLWAGIFYAGYFFMRVSIEPRVVLGPLVVVALFAYAFDEAPDPNRVVSLLGWLWAILGLIMASTFLSQWLLGAPSAIDLLRRDFRLLLVGVERVCLHKQAPPMGFDEEETLQRLEKLEMAGRLSPVQCANCRALCRAGFSFLDARPESAVGSGARDFAGWVRRFRQRVLRGPLSRPEANRPAPEIPDPGLRAAGIAMAEADQAMESGTAISLNRPPRLFLLADWKSNPNYASFAIRATLATMACYVFMSLTDWNGIHTCMITCAVTALAGVDEQMRKQNLRMIGAIIGGILGMGAVVFIIPHADSLAVYLGILAVGTALAAWVSLGNKRVSYAGWQMALAFYMTALQDPHPSTKLDIIRDRWVGIFVGIMAMRVGFACFATKR